MSSLSEIQNRIDQSASSLTNHAASTSSDQLGKSDFMNLFMYQLANQNPLDPMDSAKMMSSLAELGSMEQLQALNSGIAELGSAQKELIQLNALDYLHRKIHIQHDRINLSEQGADKISYELPKSAVSLTAKIIASSGEVVDQLDLRSVAKGNHQLQWNGQTTSGVKADLGEYRVEIHAYDDEGQDIPVNLTKETKVSQIKMENGTPMLKVGDDFISIAEALAIK